MVSLNQWLFQCAEKRDRDRYRNPITSASVFDTLLEAPKTSHSSGSESSKRNSSHSESSSTESLRNGELSILIFERATIHLDSHISTPIRRISGKTAVEDGAIGIPPPVDSQEAESFAWNWSPHATAAIARIEASAHQTDSDNYLQQLSYNCYDQTLDRLMGEFNANRHKQSWHHSVDSGQGAGAAPRAGGKTASRSRSASRKQGSDADVKDVNFWTKVFFTNGSGPASGRKSHASYPSARSPAPSSSVASANDAAATKKPSQTTTASLLNSILSNVKDNRLKSTETAAAASMPSNQTINLRELDALSAASSSVAGNANDQPSESSRKPTYNLLASIGREMRSKKSKTAAAATAGSAQQQHGTEHPQSRDPNRSNSATGHRSSLKADGILDLSDSSDPFLRTLNELRLDYDLSTSRSVEPRSSKSSKDKCVH